jgi:hypothetical protein
VGEVFELIRLQICNGVEGKAFLCEDGEKFFLKEAFLILFETADPFLNGVKLLADIPAGDVLHSWSGGVQGVKASNADLEKLVEVGTGDGEELDSIQDGEIWSQGFVEDPLVEFEPGEFAVDVRGLHEC